MTTHTGGEMDKLRELSANATPGTWRTAAKRDPDQEWEVCDCGGPSEDGGETTVVADMMDYCMPAEDDAAFIVACVNHVRAQLAGGGDGWPVPHQECYSVEDSDNWYDCPSDADIVDGLELGEEFMLRVSHYSIDRTYVVTKVPDDTSDDYEVQPLAPTKETES